MCRGEGLENRPIIITRLREAVIVPIRWTQGRVAVREGTRGFGRGSEGAVALRIMAALERSCEPDVPACQQQLCIIGCLPHVNACLLCPTVLRLPLPSYSPPWTIPARTLARPFQWAPTFPSSLPSSRRACGQIYGLARYNKQWRSNEPSLTVNYRFPSSIQAPRGIPENEIVPFIVTLMPNSVAILSSSAPLTGPIIHGISVQRLRIPPSLGDFTSGLSRRVNPGCTPMRHAEIDRRIE